MGRRGPEEVRLHKIGVNMLKQITCMYILSKDKSKNFQKSWVTCFAVGLFLGLLFHWFTCL